MVSGSCVGTALRGAWGATRTLWPLPLSQGPKAHSAGWQLHTIAGGHPCLSGPHASSSSCLEPQKPHEQLSQQQQDPHGQRYYSLQQKPHDGRHSLQQRQSRWYPWRSGGGGNPLSLRTPGHQDGSPLLAAAAQTTPLSCTMTPPRHLVAAAAFMAQPTVSVLHSVVRSGRGTRLWGLEKRDLGAMPSPSGLHTEARVGRDARFSSLEERDLAVFREVVGAAGVVEDPEALEPYNRCVSWGGGGSELIRDQGCTPLTCYPGA